MSDKNGIAQVDKPVQLTWRNRRVKTRENGNGEFFCLIEFEFDEEAWGFLKTIPRNANGEMVIWVTEVGMVAEKKTRQKPSKGQYGALWKQLFLAGFVNSPGVTEAIDKAYSEPGKTRWDALHAMFGVESLAAVSPEQIYEMFPPSEFPQAQVMVEQARRKVGE